MNNSSLMGIIVGALLVTLLLYSIFKYVFFKLGRPKRQAKVLGWGACMILLLVLCVALYGNLAPLLIYGTAVSFWLGIDLLRKEE